MEGTTGLRTIVMAGEPEMRSGIPVGIQLHVGSPIEGAEKNVALFVDRILVVMTCSLREMGKVTQENMLRKPCATPLPIWVVLQEN